PHRSDAAGTILEIEPEEDSIAARAVDLAALERLPDRVAVAPVGVHGDQPTGHEERRLALEIDELEELRVGGHRIERDRLGTALDRRAVHAPEPRRVARAGGLRHHAPLVVLVTGARPRAVVVARGDQAEAKAAWITRLVEVADRKPVLHRVAGTHAERGQE